MELQSRASLKTPGPIKRGYVQNDALSSGGKIPAGFRPVTTPGRLVSRHKVERITCDGSIMYTRDASTENIYQLDVTFP